MVFQNNASAAPPRWKCNTCLIQNAATRDICEACEAPKPGAVKAAGPQFLFDKPSAPSNCPFLKNIFGSVSTDAPQFGASGFSASFGPSSTDVNKSTSQSENVSTAANIMANNHVGGFRPGALPPINTVVSPAVAEDEKASDTVMSGRPNIPNLYSSKGIRHLDANNTNLSSANDGEVFTWGGGECDQLPFDESDLDDTNSLAIPHLIPNLTVRSIACGALHSLALLSNGHLMSWGCNDDRVLGRQGDERKPDAVQGLSKVRSISCGDNHSACITEDGACHIWGVYKDSGGFIGFPVFSDSQIEGGEKKSCRLPTKVVSLPGPCEVLASGENHTIVLCRADASFNNSSEDEAILYVWGDTEFGQLGKEAIEGHSDAITHLKYLSLFPQSHSSSSFGVKGAKIISVFAGGGTTFVKLSCPLPVEKSKRRIAASARKALPPAESTSESLQYFGCGRNFNGEVGIGYAGATGDQVKDSKICKFKELQTLRGKDVSKIVGGQFFSAALTSAGTVYTWGSGEFTCHGEVNQRRQIAAPKKVDGLDDIEHEVGVVSDIGVGSGTGYMTTSKGLLFSWGEGISMQLGTGKEEFDPVTKLQFVAPNAFGGRRVIGATGGSQHSLAMVSAPYEAPVLKRRRVANAAGTPKVTVAVDESTASGALPKKRGQNRPDDVSSGRKRIRYVSAESTKDKIVEQKPSDEGDVIMDASVLIPRDSALQHDLSKPIRGRGRNKNLISITTDNSVVAPISGRRVRSQAVTTNQSQSEARNEVLERAKPDPSSTVSVGAAFSEEKATEGSHVVRTTRSRRKVNRDEDVLAVRKRSASKVVSEKTGSKKMRRTGRSPGPTEHLPVTKEMTISTKNMSLRRRKSTGAATAQRGPKHASPKRHAGEVEPVKQTAKVPVRRKAQNTNRGQNVGNVDGKSVASENVPTKALKVTASGKVEGGTSEKPAPLTRAQRLEARRTAKN